MTQCRGSVGQEPRFEHAEGHPERCSATRGGAIWPVTVIHGPSRTSRRVDRRRAIAPGHSRRSQAPAAVHNRALTALNGSLHLISEKRLRDAQLLVSELVTHAVRDGGALARTPRAAEPRGDAGRLRRPPWRSRSTGRSPSASSPRTSCRGASRQSGRVPRGSSVASAKPCERLHPTRRARVAGAHQLRRRGLRLARWE